MSQKAPTPDASGGKDRLLEALKEAVSKGKTDPSKASLMGMFATMEESLAGDVRAAVDDFRRLVMEWRRSPLPTHLTMVPAENATWTREQEVVARTGALRQAGFKAAGVFQVQEMPGVGIAGFFNEAMRATASITRIKDRWMIDVTSHYADGSVFELTDAPAKPGLTHPSWNQRQHRQELGVQELVCEFERSRPRGDILAVGERQFVEWSADTFSRIQQWRAERGGWTKDEIAAQRGHADSVGADEETMMAWFQNRERWVFTWLRMQRDLPFRVEDVLESLVVVHEDLPDDLLANTWWCGTGDYAVRHGKFEGEAPQDTFAQVNRERGEPLKLVHQKRSAPMVDFYLPQSRPRRLAAQGPVADALEAGLDKGDLQIAVRKLADGRLQGRVGAEAVCEVLNLVRQSPMHDMPKQVKAICRLFQRTAGEGCEAWELLKQDGLPVLQTFHDDWRDRQDPQFTEVLLALVKTFALYRTAEGADRVVEAVRARLGMDEMAWSGIFGQLTADHPHTTRVFDALAGCLPTGHAGFALLEAANALRLGGDEIHHPFDTNEGQQLLLTWLSDPDPENYGLAHSATAAIPFLSASRVEALLRAAQAHPDLVVRMEAAWAWARLGNESGVKRLSEYCLERESSVRAQQYLKELGREDQVPEAARDPGFAALAEFSEWLAHPNELARHPEQMEIMDHREVPWPPSREKKPLWLIRYHAQPTEPGEEAIEGCGLVGSVTFALFGYNLHQRPVSEAYAVHCYWEMEQEGLIEEEEIEEGSDEAASLLSHWEGRPLAEARVTHRVRLDPQLGYPAGEIGVAEAKLDGNAVLVILDGARSEAFPLEADDVAKALRLKVHVGLQLLGDQGSPCGEIGGCRHPVTP